ncbi:MAG: fatty acid desaturase, partial [Rhodospirillales bacterium]|nr:fatty acid desaturase [Rhodospirillales bacterium]
MTGLTHDEAHIRAPKPAAMMHLATRSDLKGLQRLSIHIGLLLAMGLLVAMLPGWWKAPAVLGLGIVQAALFAPFHETMHQTAFASRRINAVVGWLTGALSLYSWHFYQSYHPVSYMVFNGYLLRMLGVPYWRSRIRYIIEGLRGDFSAYPFIHPDAAPRISRSIRWMVAFILALALFIVLAFGWQALLLYWVLPQLLGQPFLRLYLLTEHTLCTQDRDGLTNTRTMLTTPLVRLLMWNMPYHAEHHLYPFVPFHRLADVHQQIRGKLAHVHPGYTNWHRGFLGKIRA